VRPLRPVRAVSLAGRRSAVARFVPVVVSGLTPVRLCGRAVFGGFFGADFLYFGGAEFAFVEFFFGFFAGAFFEFRFAFFAFVFGFVRFFEGQRFRFGFGRGAVRRAGGQQQAGEEQQDEEQGESVGHGRIHRRAMALPLAKSV
jgi:hypothetical protein